jgi:hypothetical protein
VKKGDVFMLVWLFGRVAIGFSLKLLCGFFASSSYHPRYQSGVIPI